MKKTALTILTSMLIFWIFSCKKSDTSPSTTTTTGTTTSSTTSGTTSSTTSSTTSGGGGGAISYNDGAAISADSAIAVLYSTNPGTGVQREIDVYAFKSGMQVMEFHFLPKSGSQVIGNTFANAMLTYMTNNGVNYPSDYYAAVSGSFNLSSCDTVGNVLTGSFDFIGNNGSANKTISSGLINIHKIKRN